MIESCTENLNEIKSALEQLNDDQFAQPVDVLSMASIGQHVRHVVEFYQCLINGWEQGCINYDQRKRNHSIESEVSKAISAIEELKHGLGQLPENCALKLEGDTGVKQAQLFSIETNLQRELAYNLEHAIHHQALIKIGLHALRCESVLKAGFGVAPSTLRSQ